MNITLKKILLTSLLFSAIGKASQEEEQYIVYNEHYKILPRRSDSNFLVRETYPDRPGSTYMLPSAALSKAVKEDDFEKLDFLFRQGADVDGQDGHDRTVLMKAAESGQVKMVKFLIENKADVNTESSYYPCTALKEAVINNHEKVAKIIKREKRLLGRKKMIPGIYAASKKFSLGLPREIAELILDFVE